MTLPIPHSAFHVPLLFADRETLLREMGREFRGERAKVDFTDVLLVVAATVVAVVVFWLLARFAALREGRGPANNPKLLFTQLCQAHGLNRAQRRLLIQLGEQAQVAPTSAIFLRPELLDKALADPQFGPFHADLAALRSRLFSAS
jgi:hypothetical protein